MERILGSVAVRAGFAQVGHGLPRTAYCVLRTAYRPPPTAHRLLRTAYCLPQPPGWQKKRTNGESVTQNVSPRDLLQIIGAKAAQSIVMARPLTPRMIRSRVHDLKVSTSVRLHIREKIQKPLSFIQEPVIEPQPMAAAR